MITPNAKLYEAVKQPTTRYTDNRRRAFINPRTASNAIREVERIKPMTKERTTDPPKIMVLIPAAVLSSRI